MSSRLDDIRARASVETTGFFATADGRDLPRPERVPQITTYYESIPMIATSPATLVERADVLWLCDRLAELFAACEAAAEMIELDLAEGADRRGLWQQLAAAIAKTRGQS